MFLAKKGQGMLQSEPAPGHGVRVFIFLLWARISCRGLRRIFIGFPGVFSIC